MIEFLQTLPYKTYAGLFFCSLFISYWLVPKVFWFARGVGLFAHSKSAPPTPALGGLIIGIPFIIGITLLMLLKNQVSANMYIVPLHLRGLFFGSGLVLAIGLAQDLFKFNYILRTPLLAGVAALAYHHGFRLEMLIYPGSPLPEFVNFFFTAFWIVGLIALLDFFNRNNDSLAHVALFLTVALLIVSFIFDQYRTIVICCLLSGSLAGILAQEASLRPNLGSTGTFFLGFVLSVTALQSKTPDGVFDLFGLIFGGTLLGLMLISKLSAYILYPANRPQRQRYQIESLYYFKKGFSLKIEAATAPDEYWSLICEAAREFGYHHISQHSNLGDKLRELQIRDCEDPDIISFSLHLSGGQLQIMYSRAEQQVDDIQRQSLFKALTESYDRKLEADTISAVKQRDNALRIILVNRYFSGMSATGQIIEDLANDLVREGIAVTVLTSGLSYDSSILLPGRNELVGDVHVYRLPTTHFGRANALNRIMDFAFFYMFSAYWILMKPTHSYTHIMTFTDPPLIATIGYLAKRLKGWRFIYNIQDLYPDMAIALGMIKRGWVSNLCNMANRRLLREADSIIAIGENIARHVASITDTSDRVEIIPNWADGKVIYPLPVAKEVLRAELGFANAYTVIYTGNIGLAQEIETLIKIVRFFKSRQDIQFLFVGGGVKLSYLEKSIVEFGLNNVHFIEYQHRNELSRYLAASDIGLVSLSPRIEGLAIPTKTHGYLAAGIPVLSIAAPHSELAKLAKLNLGVHFSAGDTGEIIAFLESEIRGSGRFQTQYIRTYFEEKLDRPRRTRHYCTLLSNL